MCGVCEAVSDACGQGYCAKKSPKSAALKPCPFCGADAVLTTIPAHKHPISRLLDFGGSVTVECVVCDCGIVRDTEVAAIQSWNKRVPAKEVTA